MKLIVIFLYLTAVMNSFAQEDLLDILNDESETEQEFIESAFKGTRVANAQSLEIPKPKILQFMILQMV